MSSARAVAATFVLLASAVPLPAQEPTQPQQVSPEGINQQWVSASRAFDARRNQLLTQMQQVIDAGPYRADWPSLRRHQTPVWFNDAKFGIFLHWGVFSVPAFGNEWYSRNMYQPGSPEFKHQQATFGPQSRFGYKDFIPKFTMQQFDPQDWADLFVLSGAKYVVPVAEHHDGFALYATSLTRWNAVGMGPHRDILADLGTAVRHKGLKFGVSYHRAEHDWFFDGGREFDSDVNDPAFADFYGPAEHHDLETKDDPGFHRDYTFVSEAFRRDWQARVVELEQHIHPDLVYFDWWVGSPDFRATEEQTAAYLYDAAAKADQQVVLFTKYDNMAPGSATHDVERGALTEISPEPWQTDTSLSNASWGYVEGDTYKTPQMIIDQLVDVVSKNGNLLLNIGPKPDGTIPQPAREALLTVGHWLQRNGEAIYGSRPWKQYGEGPHRVQAGSFGDAQAPAYDAQDIRYTSRQGRIYAIVMRWPANNAVNLTALGSEALQVHAVALLGSSEKLQWRQSNGVLQVTLPASETYRTNPTLRIELQ